jgi:hypothetical protein
MKAFTAMALILACCLTSCTQIEGEQASEPGLDQAIWSRNAIEAKYPDFIGFENQESFAGKSVEIEKSGDDYYFIFMVHGSGLPIVNATCFRVDSEGKVFQTGTFPDSLDSYAGYGKINPVTCRGIREPVGKTTTNQPR